MASGLLIKQKQLLAGDGIAINHGETASTISLAENALDKAVRIYDATVDAETGVITITDGTPVSDLAIGDEIRTPDGVYQKIKDNITTTGSADGSRIEVSGITSPADANGLYILTETDRKWKHESADYWISSWNNAYYWMISAVEDAANPGSSLFYGYTASSSMPWEVTSWTSSSGAAGTPVVENAPVEQVITNTIDLFEYASLPVEPENIVQSVNGNKPDASGNVIIETGSSVDESRLLPEDAANGDVPVFNAAATTGGGNDATTKLLLQPLTGESTIVDTAAGNEAPVPITNNGGVTVGADGGMVFNGSSSSYLTIQANTLPSDIFDGETDFTIDIVYSAQQPGGDYACIFGKGEPPGRFDFLMSSSGSIHNGGGPSFGDGWPFNTVVRFTLEVYKDADIWKYAVYRDGAVVTTGSWNNSVEWRENFQPIGSDGYYRYFNGTIYALRISNTAVHKGESFTPEPLPWTVQQTVGSWENQNLPSKIDDKISTHNADTSAHPDKLPLSGGQMTGELKLGASSGARLNNKDGYGVIFRKDASSFYILVTAQNDEDGSYTAQRPLKLDLATGICSINGAATTDSAGNIIHTTYAPLNHPTFSGGIELTSTTPYIDFHYNNSESDYTFRIVQNTADTLTLGGKVAVSGSLSVAGIVSTQEIQSSSSNSFRLMNNNYGTFWRNDDNDLYLMITNAGDPTGTYNSLRPLTVDLATGVCNISGSALETETKLANTGVYPRVSMNTTQTSDFNTFLTQGVYWFPNGVHPNGPLGDDANCTGVLCVYNVQNSHYVQIFYMRSGTGEGNHIMYYRWQYSGTWTNWMTISGNNELATGTNNYNNVTSPGSYYFSYGDNTSNVNAPANGPFHLIVHRYYNAAGTTNRVLQTAIPQIVSTGQTATVYIRTASEDNGAYTWQPWTKLLTEKDIKYTTGGVNTGVGEEKNDYIVIGNCVIYIGQFKKILPTSGSFYLPISASNVTIMMNLAKMDSNATAPTSIACDCSGTTVTYKIDGELSSGYVYINWIGIGYLS